MVRRFAIGVLMALALRTGQAAADPEAKTSSLSWLRMPGTESCVATQALARAVEERLGHPVFVSAAQADLSIEGRIERRAGKFHAVITVRDAHGASIGNRELEREGPSCDAMTEPLALVIAVMIDPDAALHPKAPPPPQVRPEEVPPPTPTPTPTPKEEPPPARIERPPPPRKADPWGFDAQVYGTMNVGLAPSAAFGGGAQGMLYFPGVPIALRGYGSVFAPTTAEKDGARADIDLLYGGSAWCLALRRRVNLLGCFGGQLGLTRARAQTKDRAIDEDFQVLLDAIAEARVHIPLVAPLGAAVGVGGGVPILRPETQVRRSDGSGTDVLHRPAAFTLTADVGLGFFFP